MTTPFQKQMDNALTEARQFFQEGNTAQATTAWDTVEELFAEASHKSGVSNFKQYCQDNPWADECRIYDV